MSHGEIHKEILEKIRAQFEALLENSSQAMYIYLDESNKICNEKFAKMLGYSSSKDWEDAIGSFTELFVEDESQDILVGAYQKSMEELAGSKISVSWKKISGGFVESEVIIVPIIFEDHSFAVHYISVVS